MGRQGPPSGPRSANRCGYAIKLLFPLHGWFQQLPYYIAKKNNPIVSVHFKAIFSERWVMGKLNRFMCSWDWVHHWWMLWYTCHPCPLRLQRCYCYMVCWYSDQGNNHRDSPNLISNLVIHLRFELRPLKSFLERDNLEHPTRAILVRMGSWQQWQHCGYPWKVQGTHGVFVKVVKIHDGARSRGKADKISFYGLLELWVTGYYIEKVYHEKYTHVLCQNHYGVASWNHKVSIFL